MNAPVKVAIDRSKFLGGSDVAAVFGVSPWKTPLQLWQDKITPRAVDPIKDAKREKFFARRKRQEPVIAEMLLDEYGIEVTRLSIDSDPNRYIDPEHPFLAAEVDFEFLMSESVREAFPGRVEFCAIPDGALLSGEIKTVHPFSAGEWGEQGSEDVPIHYAAQVMHGLGVAPGRRPAALVAALFGLDTLLAFPVMRDDETIAAMREKAVRFWIDHVQTGIPPQIVNVPDFKILYSKYTGKPVDLSEEALAALRGLEELRSQAKQIEQDKAECEWEIARCVALQWGVDVVSVRDGMPEVPKSTENALLMYGGRQVGSWNRQRGSYLDQKRLAHEKPEITAAFTVEHHYRVMRMKRGK